MSSKADWLGGLDDDLDLLRLLLREMEEHLEML